MSKCVASNQVWRWPEFKAFAKRLGIPEQRSRDLIIKMYFDGEVIIEHQYVGEDKSNE